MTQSRTILAIETSCDETSIAIVSYNREQNLITTCAHITASQADFHAQYGGVFPAMAKREHAKNIVPVLIEALTQAGLLHTKNEIIDPEKKALLEKILEREHELSEIFFKELLSIEVPSIDTIAVTAGPGLEPALWVGVNFARGLGALWNIPVIPINHMEGHIVGSAVEVLSENSNHDRFRAISFPFLSLLISGGHTEIIKVSSWGDYEKIGQTLDDALGEAFDKVARVLGLPYPGGPKVSALALVHRETHPHWKPEKPLPRPMIHSKDLNFSFSGIKTAVLYKVRDIGILTEEIKQEIARDFEDAVTEVIIKKISDALDEHGGEMLLVGGGVSLNQQIKKGLEELTNTRSVELYFPAKDVSTDNAKMIALVALLTAKNPADNIVAQGSWELGQSD